MENCIGRTDFLKDLPPVEFCCTYGSALLGNTNKTTMVDHILGVSDPLKWHSENLELNRDHYGSWIPHLGGAKLVTHVADKIGVGVHFNPFVNWNDRMIKYGVVRMHDLVQDIVHWEKFYLSGRLQKPVDILVDNLDIKNQNFVNLKGAISAALLLLPPEFTEEELYAKICSLSYMGDLRMLFAEDKHKVKKIVQGQFDLFETMYKPFLEGYAGEDLVRFSSCGGGGHRIIQDCDIAATRSLVSSIPSTIRSSMERKLGLSGMSGSREEAVNCMRKALRRKVMVSSTRQAISGLVTAGGFHAVRYLSNKMSKWWNS